MKWQLVRTVVFYLISLSVLLISMTANAAEAGAKWCEQQWLVEAAEFGNRDVPDYAGLRTRWQQYADKCRGTVAYEARLAITYAHLHQSDKARKVLKSVAGRSSEYAYLVELAGLQADTMELVSANSLDEEHLREFERKYASFVKRYPSLVEGYGLLGGVQTMLGEYLNAAKTLEKALDIQPDMRDWGLLRNLTIDYAALGVHQSAYVAASLALEVRKGLMSDTPFMCALANADIGLGKLKDADKVLRVLVAKTPEARSAPEFLAAVRLLQSKAAGTGNQEKSVSR